MGVSNLNAEMLLANYFSAGMLAKYAKALGKSDKGSAATLAERIAREWAKPSFAPPASTTTAAAKRTTAVSAPAGLDVRTGREIEPAGWVQSWCGRNMR